MLLLQIWLSLLLFHQCRNSVGALRPRSEQPCRGQAWEATHVLHVLVEEEQSQSPHIPSLDILVRHGWVGLKERLTCCITMTPCLCKTLNSPGILQSPAQRFKERRQVGRGNWVGETYTCSDRWICTSSWTDKMWSGRMMVLAPQGEQDWSQTWYKVGS